jgi:hypothetical protein
MLDTLATLDPPLVFVALGAPSGIVLIVIFQIWRPRRQRHGRKRVKVWTPY